MCFRPIRDRAQRGFAQGVFGGTHVFTPSSDVPDDWALRLVVLPPDAALQQERNLVAMSARPKSCESAATSPATSRIG